MLSDGGFSPWSRSLSYIDTVLCFLFGTVARQELPSRDLDLLRLQWWLLLTNFKVQSTLEFFKAIWLEKIDPMPT